MDLTEYVINDVKPQGLATKINELQILLNHLTYQTWAILIVDKVICLLLQTVIIVVDKLFVRLLHRRYVIGDRIRQRYGGLRYLRAATYKRSQNEKYNKSKCHINLLINSVLNLNKATMFAINIG